MNDAYLSAVAALAGSAVGGLTSFFSTWLGQGAQLKAQLFVHDKGRRQELYSDFINEASKCYIEGLTSSSPDLANIIALYAQISRMRVLSSPAVIDEALKVTRRIVDSYPEPNKNFDDLRAMISEHMLDPLRGFSHACRKEMSTGEPPLAIPTHRHPAELDDIT